MIPILKIYAATVILHTLCVFGVIIVPDLPPKQYVTEGDLKLGGIFPISGYSGSGPCGPEIRNTGILQYIEAMVFAVKEINNRSDILPNVTLGFAILDSCLKPTTALVQALHFVPRQQMAPHKNPTARAQNGGYNEIEGEATNAYRDHFEVEGVIGAMLSANSIEVANILTPFYVPQISYASTSDILSDKSTYKYFLRLAPPDRFQTQAMIDLHRHFDWSYSSLLYLEGAYGEGGAKAFRELAKSAGICIAVDAMIKEVMSEAEYDDVISNLVANQKARVVILYVGARHVRQVFLSVRRLNATGKFIWIGSDSWASRLSQINGLEDVLLGALTFKVHASYVPAAHDYFQTLNLDNNLANPWFVQFWEKYFQCSLKDNATNPCKPNLAISNSKHFKPSSSIAPVVDSVYTFGYALHRMRNDLCPLATGAALRECIEGRELLKYLKKSVFVGNNGEVIFNENGDVLGRYDIQQSQRINGVYRQTDVGFWDAKIPGLVLRQDVVNWNTSFAEVGAGVPESVCSKPCKAGEYRVQLELKCCWECRKCFKNEISSANDTRCTVCPEFTWPNKTSPNTCVTIKPTFMNWQDPLCIALVCFSLVGVSCTASIAVFYLKNSHTRLIKASSRELSYIMLIGTVLCYLTVFTFVGKPEESVCKAAYFGFGLSFTWIYGPLMVKTNRIYRIFKSGRTSNVLPPLVSPRSQVLIAGVVISIQVSKTTSILFFVLQTLRKNFPGKVNPMIAKLWN